MGVLDDAIREHLELKRRRGADAGEVARLESEALGPVRRSPAGVPDMSDVPAAAPADSEGAPLEDAPAADPISAPEPPPAYEPPEPPAGSAFSSAPLRPRPAPYEPSSPPPEPYEPPVPGRSAYEAPPSPPPPADEPPPTAILRPPPITSEHSTVEPHEPLHQPEDEPEPPAPAAEHEPSTSLLSRFSPGRRLRLRRQSEPEEELTVGYKPPTARDEPPTARDERPPYAAPPPTDYDAPLPTPHEADIVPADDEPDAEDLLEETPEFLEETPEHDRLWFEQRPPRDFDFDG